MTEDQKTEINGEVPALSGGFIESVVNTDMSNPPAAVLQIVSLKANDTEKGVRYRVILSDGKEVVQGTLASQYVEQAQNETINRFCVVRLNRFTVHTVHDSKLVMILDMDILNNVQKDKIGNPSVGPKAPAPATGNQGSSPTKMPATPSPSSSPQKLRQPNFSVAADPFKLPDVIPIAGLNPYQTRWAIKARVASKSDMKNWSNPRGSGKLFSADLIDDSGEIKATAFNEQADSFFSKLEVGKIYIISRGSIKAARKQFTSIKNDYELSFDHNTVIRLAEDQDSSLPTFKFTFTPIEKISQLAKDTMIDVIGVVHDAGEASMTKTRMQKDLLKRDVTLVDTSGKSVRLTLWNATAETHIADHCVLAVKGVKISDFGGCSLSATQQSVVAVNPDHPQTHTLRSWYDSVGSKTSFASLSSEARAAAFDDNRKMIKDVELEGLGKSPEKPDVFVVKGTITNIPHEKPFYYASCPETKTKVIQEAQGWWSEKAGKHFSECDYRYVAKMQIMDASGGLWLNAFHEAASAIIQKEAAELVRAKEDGNTDYVNQVMGEAYFKTWHFKVKSKPEVYQGETYVRHSIIACKPIDYVAECRSLMTAIEAYGK